MAKHFYMLHIFFLIFLSPCASCLYGEWSGGGVEGFQIKSTVFRFEFIALINVDPCNVQFGPNKPNHTSMDFADG